MRPDYYKDYYFNELGPAFTRYVETFDSRSGGTVALYNAAMEAAGKLFHLREAINESTGIERSRKDIGDLCWSYQLIGDVFNSSKHVKINRGDRLINGRKDVHTIVCCSIVPYENNPSDWYFYSDFRVIVHPIKSDPIDLLKLAAEVLRFWGWYLYKENLLEQVLQYEYKGDEPLSPELATQKIDVHLVDNKPEGVGEMTMVYRLWDLEKKDWVPFTGQVALEKDGVPIQPAHVSRPPKSARKRWGL
ncbi:hypothetical protein IC229_16795 [Spirosoma sp. BT702]|uniref:Uncharacterized protein n=1 Tax=Spirosoma profusum TaxID=2771354 RepID=A0A926XY34_9BACT|nr:hypothetical protein [Spirosoma profusum]MBD2702310.1 hypothetical protein [Spirosoma profusum]